MLRLLFTFLETARSAFKTRRDLALENLALRQQLSVLRHQVTRARPMKTDRAFWVVLSQLWDRWTDSLVFVKPETVIGWHRKGFALFWTWKSRSKGGRPRVPREVRTLIGTMAPEIPTWGAPRIHGELSKLGFSLCEATVSRYMPRRRKPPSQTWRTFLDNHAHDLVSVDFFVVPSATFRLLLQPPPRRRPRRRRNLSALAAIYSQARGGPGCSCGLFALASTSSRRSRRS